MSLTKTLRFALALQLTNLKSALALRASFCLSLLFMALNNATFFVFWWLLFSRVGSLRGWRVAEVELLFGISATGFGLMQVFAGGVTRLSRMIDDGALDPLLAQPKPTLLYALCSRCEASGFGDVLSGLAFLAHSGYLTVHSAPRVLLCLVASALTFTSTGIVLHSLAFWLRRTHVLARWLMDLTITFSLYPEPLFTGLLKLLLFTLLPAGFVSFLPAEVIREGSLPAELLLLLGAALYWRLAERVFELGLRRYSSGSRFGVFG
jgi:ABC-2 type transport system permease protein